jgi:hypothetical protein
MLNTTEAIERHLEGLLIDNEDIPSPQPIEIHQSDFQDGIWEIVTVDLTKISGKAKRINISIPERLLSKIDAKAKSLGENRSSFLLTAALEMMR